MAHRFLKTLKGVKRFNEILEISLKYFATPPNILKGWMARTVVPSARNVEMADSRLPRMEMPPDYLVWRIRPTGRRRAPELEIHTTIQQSTPIRKRGHR